MKVFDARYFDGKTSACHHVSVVLTGAKLRLVGTHVSAEFDARGVRRSLRIADTPRWLYLPGGGVCVTEDNDVVDAMVRERRYDRLLHQWESRPAYALLSVVLVVVAAWFLIDRGLPVAAEQIAKRIPVEAEATLGREVMRGLDDYLMRPSRLPRARQAQLREKLFLMMRAAGDTTRYRLEFRASAMGANAFALPSGIIVMTDELVELAERDEEILAVLAHEVGHLHHRHTMRRLLEGSATALLIAGITGDIGSAAALASAAPTMLLQTKYSRKNETEADQYAVELMRRAKLEPYHLGVILGRLEESHGGGRGVPTFLSSHPATEERAQLAGSRPAKEVTAAKQEAEPAKPQIKVANPLQSEMLALLARRDFVALEARLAGLQVAFEQDESASAALIAAYRGFRRAPDDIALNEWVAKHPQSYAARTARGEFYAWRGVTRPRPGRDAPAWKQAEAHADFLLAREDFVVSLGLTGKPFISRLTLILVNRHAGTKEEGLEHFLEAIKLAPQAVEPRLARMKSLEPRWGGSMEEMEAFAAESAKALRDPGAAAQVTAEVSFEKATERQNARDYEGALRHYGDGLRLAKNNAYMLCSRSWIHATLKRHAAAYSDVKLALTIEPDNEYCLERATHEIFNLKDQGERIRMATHIIEMKPGVPEAYNQRGYAYTAIGKPDAAFPDLMASAKLGDAWAQATVGHAYLNGIGTKKDPEAARPWLERAAAQGEPEAIKLLEHLDRQKSAKKG